MMLFDLKQRLTFLVVMVVLIVAACAPASQPATPTSAPATATAAPAPTTAKVVPQGKVVIGTSAEPPSYDCHKGIGAPEYAAHLNIYDGGSGLRGNILARNKEGLLAPGLASEWKVSPDGKRWDFTLRQGVKFVNGDPVTMDDVRWSWERVTKPEVQPNVSLYAAVDRLEVVDSTRFTFQMKSFTLVLPIQNGFLCVMPQRYFESAGETAFGRSPVGTGPYKLTNVTPGESFGLEAFTDYWGGPPATKTALVRIIPDDSTRVATLLAKETDLITNVPPERSSEVRAKQDLAILEYPTWFPLNLVMNTWVTPFGDKRVRQAMYYAIDRQAITDKVLLRLGTVYTTVPQQHVGWTPELNPYPYNPEKARQLLREAGYPNGFTLNLYGLAAGRVAKPKEVIEAVGAYLQAVGMVPNIRTFDYGAFILNYRRTGPKGPEAAKEKMDGVTFFLGDIIGVPGGDEPGRGLAFLSGSAAIYSWYDDPQVEKLTDQVLATPDFAARVEIYKQIYKIMNDQAYRISLYTESVAFGLNKRIAYSPRKGLFLATELEVKDIKVLAP